MYTVSREQLLSPAIEQRSMLAARDHYDISFFESQAKRLVDEKEKNEYDAWYEEPLVNARTAIFEELTAKGHLSIVESDLDVDVANEATLRRLINGWSDNLPEWEKKRRFYEVVEELTIQQVWQDIQAGVIPADTIIGTISDYPEIANDDEAHDIGYRSLNHKGMVRATYFRKNKLDQWVRVVEQCSRSNSNNGSSDSFLRSRGIRFDGMGISEEVISSQFLATRSELPDGAVSIMKDLDRLSGSYTRYGEDVRKAFPPLPEYNELRFISRRREQQAEYFIKQLANFEKRIDIRYKNGEISYPRKLLEYRRERTRLVDEILLLDPSYAKDARGELSGKYYEKAALAMAAGDDQLAQQHYESALRSADPKASAVCGGIGINEKPGLNEEGKQTYQDAKNAREFWKWKKGICIVRKCPSRPNKTEVGPCCVCHKCQELFDKNKDPNKIYKTAENVSSVKKDSYDIVMEPLREWNRRYDKQELGKKGQQTTRDVRPLRV